MKMPDAVAYSCALVRVIMLSAALAMLVCGWLADWEIVNQKLKTDGGRSNSTLRWNLEMPLPCT